MIATRKRVARVRPLVPLALCLVVVALLVAIRPDPATDFRRSYSDVGVNRPDGSGPSTWRYQRARVAAVPRDGSAFVSEQALIIVTVEASVRTTRTFFGAIALITADGHVVRAEAGIRRAEPSITQPGFTTAGSLVFELPPSRLAGARLLVDPDGAEFDVYDAAVRVDLGLTRATPADVLDDPLPDASTWVTDDQGRQPARTLDPVRRRALVVALIICGWQATLILRFRSPEPDRSVSIGQPIVVGGVSYRLDTFEVAPSFPAAQPERNRSRRWRARCWSRSSSPRRWSTRGGTWTPSTATSP